MISDTIPSWATWNDGTVPKLARIVYDGRKSDLLPILADALEEAGYPDCDLPEKLRNPLAQYQWIRLIAPILGGQVEMAVNWVEEFLEREEVVEQSLDYDRLMIAAQDTQDRQEAVFEDWSGWFDEIATEFWDNYEIVTGTLVEHKYYYIFDCPC